MASTNEEESPRPPKSPGYGLFVFGILLSLGYVGILWFFWKSPESPFTLSANELGDFLAGVFAPLAFLWLVLGFIQQGFELRNSSKALWAQMEELKNSVEQQKGLVEATRDLRTTEMELHERSSRAALQAALPRFELNPIGHAPHRLTPSIVHDHLRDYSIALTNHGGDSSNTRVHIDGALAHRKPLLERGETIQFKFTSPAKGKHTYLGKIEFMTSAGDQYSQAFST